MAYLVPLVAYLLKGLTGFGPALLMVPLFTVIDGAPAAILLATLFDCVAGWVMFWRLRRAIAFRPLAGFLLAISAGVAFGLLVVGSLPAGALRPLIGAILLIAAASGIRSTFVAPAHGRALRELSRGERALGLFAAFLSGVSGATLGISGPPFVIYCQRYLKKSAFRDSLVVIFVIESTVRTLGFALQGRFDAEVLGLAARLAPSMLIGLAAGMALHVRISPRVFAIVVAAVLTALGVKMVLA